MTARKGRKKTGDISAASQRESSQLQARNPALCASLKNGHLLWGQIHIHDRV
jgi:hypothetical protein